MESDVEAAAHPCVIEWADANLVGLRALGGIDRLEAGAIVHLAIDSWRLRATVQRVTDDCFVILTPRDWASHSIA
ncbi:MAG: hypothetical protein H6733_18165 [Alphaproteobacteria bacterium]|nr:hypothetical protein [Alphaproteobacteria bacterium]